MNNERGLTLIEVIMAMALIAIIGTFLAAGNIDAYRGFMFRSETNLLVTVLQKTRSESVNNVCFGACTAGKPHGVELFGGQYVVFQGTTYAGRDIAQDEIIEANTQVVRTGLTDVVFSQLSGNSTTTSATTSITMTDGQHTEIISINDEGRISW